VPISAYGGGVVVLPFEGLVLSALAIDPGGTVTNSDVTEAFDNGVMVIAGGKLDISRIPGTSAASSSRSGSPGWATRGRSFDASSSVSSRACWFRHSRRGRRTRPVPLAARR